MGDWKFYGEKTYSFLVHRENRKKYKCLLEKVTSEAIKNGFIIQVQHKYRFFIHFTTVDDFYRWYVKIPKRLKCMYEVIRGTCKPHFDIDMPVRYMEGRYQIKVGGGAWAKILDKRFNPQDLINKLVTNIQYVLEREYDVKIKLEEHVKIFTSHGTKKKSWHIVIDKFYHSNNKESEWLFDKVVEETNINEYETILEWVEAGDKPDKNPPYSKWVDSAVYSSTQNFRLVDSHKFESDRVKTFQPKWIFEGREIIHKIKIPREYRRKEDLYEFKSSLVGYVGDDSTMLMTKIELDLYQYDTEDGYVFGPEEVDFAMGKMGKDSTLGGQFRVKLGTIPTLLELERARPGLCPLCRRIHENENAFITIKGEGRAFIYHCRRNENEGYDLGALGSPPDEVDSRYTAADMVAEMYCDLYEAPSPIIKKEIEADIIDTSEDEDEDSGRDENLPYMPKTKITNSSLAMVESHKWT